MTKQEFAELTGINPTEEEFDKIHELYMATGAEMDEQSFCAAYKSCKDMTLVNAIYRSLAFSINRLKEERDSIEKERKEDRKKLEDLWEKTDEAVFNILKMSEDAPDEDHAILNSIAVSLVGKFDVCMAKLDRGYVMDAEEREYFYDKIADLRNKCEGFE
nr:MAG TPA: hypothetical protein [Caudoviricetes sp.]